MAILFCFLSAPLHAQVNVTGRWTSKYDTGAAWTNQPVHMILTRGNGGHHSQILWYDSNHAVGPGFLGGVWGWTPGSTTANSDCSQYPASHFTSLSLGSQPPHNIFCTGHSALADGRILVTGGTEGGETGVVTSAIFDPGDRTWEATDPMSERRWYPTNTTLPDGNVLVSSGSGFLDFQIHGGRITPDTGTLGPDSLQRLGLSPTGEWIAPAKSSTTGWPSARDAHSAVWNPTFTHWTIFGGRNQAGTPLQDAWIVYRTPDSDIDDQHTAFQVGGAGTQPAARYRHSAIAYSDTVVIFGGQGSSGVFNDVWEFRNPNPTTYGWSSISPSGTPPLARQGHGAVYDPVNHRMLIFGGADASDQPIDNTLYAMSTTGTRTWSQPTVNGTPPPARHGHVFLLDPLEDLTVTFHGAPSSNHKRRILVFGGEESGGLSNGLWVLWIPEPGADYEWEQVSPGGTLPSARYRLAAGADHVRFFIQGGDVGGTASAEAWGIELFRLTTGTPGSWTALASHPQRAVTGHVGMVKHLNWARKQEVFNPSSGNWTDLGSRKKQGWYPLHFVAPQTDSLRVFYAGTTTSSQYLVLSGSPPYWRPFPATSTSTGGGSAAMFLPGEVMRCGSRDTEGQNAVATTHRINLTSSPAPSSWTETASMGTGRANHNLVILPNGEVLVTGGTQGINNQANLNPVFNPQIWNPGTSTWSSLSTLAADSTIRGYHSNAILLPDGRVLTGSGTGSFASQAGIDSRKATIYCPPYLFNSSGNLRSRMVVTPTNDVDYDTEFKVCVDSNPGAPSSVVLIRPGASTHAFNQDQRYVPVSFQMQCNNREMYVTSPLHERIAPPGDYLLFVNRTNFAPSVGKWIRLGSEETPEEPLCIDGCDEGFGATISGGDGSGWNLENALATREADATPLRLSRAPVGSNGDYTLKIGQSGKSKTRLERLELWYVDHAPDQEAFAGTRNTYLGARSKSVSVASLLHGDVTAQANGEFGMSQQVESEDALVVDVGTGGESPFVVRARRGSRDVPAASSDPSVRVEVETSPGVWKEAGRFEPRLDFADATIDAIRGRVRLSSALPFQVQGAWRVDAVSVSPIAPMAPAVATSGARADRSVAVPAKGGPLAMIEGDETMVASWPATTATAGQVRSFFVRATSRTATPARSVHAADRADETIAPAHAFDLGTARPSPSSGRTTISYSLAHAAKATLRIYDAAGRLVRTLVDREAEAGPGEVVWDGRGDHGQRVPAGVYFYRMDAGEWRSQKKVVILAGSAE